MTVLLQASGLQCGYGGGTVLDGVALDVRRGEIVAIVGRNGVGKTTLMRALIGLLPLAQGSIVLDGQEISHQPAHARARLGMGYVPQGREVFPALTVRENLLVGLRGSTQRDASMPDVVMDYFPVLRARLQQKAGTMSGGEQQQLAIARALVGKPTVLLLDEPSEGIQPSIVDLIADTLARIAADTGIGVLLVEQDLGMVEHIAGRCCVMDKGRIVEWLDQTQLSDAERIRQHLAL